MALAGVLVKDPLGAQTIVRELREQAAAFGAAWSKVFAEKSVDQELGQRFAVRWMSTYNFAAAASPSISDYNEFLRHARDSAAGPDGLPYSAWAATGQDGSLTLALAEQELRSGSGMPVFFNACISVFPPKGERAGDLEGVFRLPEDTRPLGLRSTDTKVIAGVWNHTLRGVICADTVRIQSGFVPGRFLHNIVELDVEARCAGHMGAWEAAPVLACWDYAAAFASVAHNWVRLVLEKAGFPHAVILCFRGLYNLCFSDDRFGNFMFWVLSGVL